MKNALKTLMQCIIWLRQQSAQKMTHYNCITQIFALATKYISNTINCNCTTFILSYIVSDLEAEDASPQLILQMRHPQDRYLGNRSPSNCKYSNNYFPGINIFLKKKIEKLPILAL